LQVGWKKETPRTIISYLGCDARLDFTGNAKVIMILMKSEFQNEYCVIYMHYFLGVVKTFFLRVHVMTKHVMFSEARPSILK
jgi:hypothetical protein